MTNINLSIKLNDQQIQQLKQHLDDDCQVESKNSHLQQSWKIHKVSFLLYKSKNLSIQGKLELSDQKWKFLNPIIPNWRKLILAQINKQPKDTNQQNKNLVIPEAYFAADESGVGDYFGGFSVCVVVWNQALVDKLNKHPELFRQIQDSKNIADNNKLVALVKQLKPIINGHFQVGTCNPTYYNELYSKLENKNTIVTFMHEKAFRKIIEKKNPEFLKIQDRVIDDFCGHNKYQEHVQTLMDKDQIEGKTKQKVLLFTKAESTHSGVALASMIARDDFLKQIQTICDKYQINIPLGSSDEQAIKAACQQLLNKGLTKRMITTQIVKGHFATTNKVF